MLNKLIIMLQTCHKGEIFKRIEYKIKDLLGYFKLRNKLLKVDNHYDINLPKFKLTLKPEKKDDSYFVFGQKINYDQIEDYLYSNNLFWRNNNIGQYDDIKVVWEHNRLQFLPSIALKYRNNKETKYKTIIIDTLDYWFNKNRYEYSINWTNNLEVAIRSISLFMTLLILNDKKLNQKYSKLLYLHGLYLYNEINYSKYCIPNNHLIGEAVALLILSNIIDYKCSQKWKNRAIKILNKYCDIIADDGSSYENSFSYQFFVTKMFILSLSFIEDARLYTKINRKVLASLELLNLTVYKNNVINYGDNDDGYYFTTCVKYNLKNDIVRYYNLFFNNKLDYETEIIKKLLDLNKNKMIFGKKKDESYFVNKNLFLYKWDNNLIFFNAKNIEGHAHDDSLHIELVINGHSVLTDSGTYSYNLNKQKREFYVSKNAHNTILTDKKNAIHIRTFRWKNLYESYLEDININNDIVEISGIIKDTCRRKIKIDKLNNIIEVFDETLDENYLIKNNWIVIDSQINKNIIENKYCDMVLKSSKIEVINNYVSKKYLEERKIRCYVTEEKKKQYTKIIIK